MLGYSYHFESFLGKDPVLSFNTLQSSFVFETVDLADYFRQ